jgi:hypothetical protein
MVTPYLPLGFQFLCYHHKDVRNHSKSRYLHVILGFNLEAGNTPCEAALNFERDIAEAGFTGSNLMNLWNICIQLPGSLREAVSHKWQH